jgi:hypothetical protein
MTVQVQIMVTGRKVIAYDVVNSRPARSGDNPPMIITIPKIVEALVEERRKS